MDSEASLHFFPGSTKRLMRSAWLEARWHFLATFVEGNGNEWIRMIRGIGVFGKQLANHQRMVSPRLMDDSVDDFRGMVCDPKTVALSRSVPANWCVLSLTASDLSSPRFTTSCLPVGFLDPQIRQQNCHHSDERTSGRLRNTSVLRCFEHLLKLHFPGDVLRFRQKIFKTHLWKRWAEEMNKIQWLKGNLRIYIF